MQVRFRREAVLDVVGARAWYDDQTAGLGDAFAASLESLIDVLACLHTSRAPEARPDR